MKNVVMNEKRVAIIKALQDANVALTLQEISAILGFEVKTGTTNAMLEAGIIKVAGTKRVPKVTYVEVNTYEIGTVPTTK